MKVPGLSGSEEMEIYRKNAPAFIFFWFREQKFSVQPAKKRSAGKKRAIGFRFSINFDRFQLVSTIKKAHGKECKLQMSRQCVPFLYGFFNWEQNLHNITKNRMPKVLCGENNALNYIFVKYFLTYSDFHLIIGVIHLTILREKDYDTGNTGRTKRRFGKADQNEEGFSKKPVRASGRKSDHAKK